MINSTIDWKSIRPLNGSQQEGFEELCSQLAENYVKDHIKFDRVGKPDAGVECYATFEDETEWGWQAKYLFQLGNIQWKEIDKSIKTALNKHPRLSKYFVCIPYDLPDARISKQKSAKEKWEIHKKKWEGWAQEFEINVEFIYWGNFQLVNQLMEEKHRGRILYWFNQQYFSQEWFTEKIESSISAAGARYTPEVNVDLPIAEKIEIFSRTEQPFTKIRNFYKVIKDKNLFLDWHSIKSDNQQLSEINSSLITNMLEICSLVSEFKYQPIGKTQIVEILEKTRSTYKLLDQFWELWDRYIDKNKKQNFGYDEIGYSIRVLRSELIELIETADEIKSLLETKLLIIRGNAGTGKTHLLCDISKKRITNNSPTILLMGQQFTNSDEPWTQIRQILDLQDIS